MTDNPYESPTTPGSRKTRRPPTRSLAVFLVTLAALFIAGAILPGFQHSGPRQTAMSAMADTLVPIIYPLEKSMRYAGFSERERLAVNVTIVLGWSFLGAAVVTGVTRGLARLFGPHRAA